MTNKPFHPDELLHYTGSTLWYRHFLCKWILYTEGMKFLAERVGAYWLIDEIVFAQKAKSSLPKQHLQIWKISVQNHSAVLECIGKDDAILYTKRVPYTDFPLSEFTVYYCNNTIMLPSEY
jgi:hypothetical protein